MTDKREVPNCCVIVIKVAGQGESESFNENNSVINFATVTSLAISV